MINNAVPPDFIALSKYFIEFEQALTAQIHFASSH